MAQHSKHRHWGTRVDEWLKAEGIFEAVTHKAMKEVMAWQLAEAITAAHLSKTDMARRMHTPARP